MLILFYYLLCLFLYIFINTAIPPFLIAKVCILFLFLGWYGCTKTTQQLLHCNLPLFVMDLHVLMWINKYEYFCCCSYCCVQQKVYWNEEKQRNGNCFCWCCCVFIRFFDLSTSTFKILVIGAVMDTNAIRRLDTQLGAVRKLASVPHRL